MYSHRAVKAQVEEVLAGVASRLQGYGLVRVEECLLQRSFAHGLHSVLLLYRRSPEWASIRWSAHVRFIEVHKLIGRLIEGVESAEYGGWTLSDTHWSSEALGIGTGVEREYYVDEDSKTELIAARMSRAVTVGALPFFDRFPDLASLAEWLEWNRKQGGLVTGMTGHALMQLAVMNLLGEGGSCRVMADYWTAQLEATGQNSGPKWIEYCRFIRNLGIGPSRATL